MLLIRSITLFCVVNIGLSQRQRNNKTSEKGLETSARRKSSNKPSKNATKNDLFTELDRDDHQFGSILSPLRHGGYSDYNSDESSEEYDSPQAISLEDGFSDDSYDESSPSKSSEEKGHGQYGHHKPTKPSKPGFHSEESDKEDYSDEHSEDYNDESQSQEISSGDQELKRYAFFQLTNPWDPILLDVSSSLYYEIKTRLDKALTTLFSFQKTEFLSLTPCPKDGGLGIQYSFVIYISHSLDTRRLLQKLIKKFDGLLTLQGSPSLIIDLNTLVITTIPFKCQVGNLCKRGGDDAAVCKDLVIGSTCICSTGFALDENVCTDIDECKSKLCKAGGDRKAVCTNFPGSFLCQCSPGFYTVDGSCKIDKCQGLGDSYCGISGAGSCQKKTGICSCRTGFANTADGKCVFVNQATCDNVGDLFCGPNGAGRCDKITGLCSCNEGFALQGGKCLKAVIDSCNNVGDLFCGPTGAGRCDKITGLCSCNEGFTLQKGNCVKNSNFMRHECGA